MKNLVPIFFFLLINLGASGQIAGQPAIIHPIEKAYLQFDKPYYAIGDTIYFKAYVTLGPEHKLSALSGILYAELINPGNKISRSLKLQMVAGVAWGDFTLADTLKGGNYRVRAYTKWMRNEGEDAFFEQAIPIAGNAIKGITESGVPANKITKVTGGVNKIDVQFLPEGGNLVAGNYSKIAFKAIGPDGLGTDVKGTVTDDSGDVVTTFASTHLGMGSFNMVAQAGKSYKANVVFTNGVTNTIALPKALTTGYTLSLNNTNADTIRIRVTAGAGSSLDKLSIVGRSGGVICYAAENQQAGGKFFSAVIAKSRFPTGIIQFTLFNEAGEPLNERLAFINHKDDIRLKLNIKDVYAPRGKVKIDLDASNDNNKPVTGSFSVAVTDETIVHADTANENTIVTNLLLTSDLKGVVEQPNYYFAQINENSQADLDLLMLTQGYRHFEWKPGKQPELTYQPEKSLTISGTVKKNGRPAIGAKVSLVSKTGGFFMIDTLADANGKFIFPNLVFNDSTKFVVQAKVARGQDAVTLELDTILTAQTVVKSTFISKKDDGSNPGIDDYVTNQKQFNEELQKYGINKHKVLLKEVRVEAKRELAIPHSENLNGSGQADQVLTARDIERLSCGSHLADCLKGILLKTAFDEYGAPKKKAVFVDGTLVDPQVFAELRADDIEGIENITGPHYGAIYGSRAAYGALIVTTKRARKLNNYYRYAPGVVTYTPKGFNEAREFYSPQYDNPHTNQKMPDLRSTIYWNPNIITDKDGKASFEFFNADGKGTYRVVIEGIDADGNLGRQVFRYTVE